LSKEDLINEENAATKEVSGQAPEANKKQPEAKEETKQEKVEEKTEPVAEENNEPVAAETKEPVAEESEKTVEEESNEPVAEEVEPEETPEEPVAEETQEPVEAEIAEKIEDAVAEVIETPVEQPEEPTAEVEATEEIAAPQEEEKATDIEVQSETKTEEVEESTVEMADSGAHDDFDWETANENTDIYTSEERSKLSEMYEGTLTTINENEVVNGVIVAMSDSDVVVNIGFKSDGLVSTSEFRDMPDMKIGDEVEVFVVKKEDQKGQLILSRKNAKLLRAWESIVDAHNNDKVVTGTVVSKTKGGLIVNVFGLETFLPGSQIDVKPILDYDAFVGKTMEFKVVKINETIKNAVVSHKALIESDLENQRAEIISKLEKGQVLEGTIKNITDFGAFIDLGGVDGLLYITDISWGRINHPSDVLELNQNLNVVVLDFDDEKKRISLGLKQLEPHPWEVLDEKIVEGSEIKGKIVNIEDYGAFLEIQPGVEGLIHVSEVSWSNQPINAKEYFTLGVEFDAKVVTINREDRKMSLSIKQLTSDPWDGIEKNYPIGSKHSGIVKNITPYGVFVELDEFIGGMIHISDLSWIKRYNHPSEFVKVDEEMDVVVLEIDKDNRKISLGHKQLEEDPWDTFENVFPVGSIHEATLIKHDEKGGIVQLPYGLEAFAPNKHLKDENGKDLPVDSLAEFKILEFNRDDKRIIVSHSRANEDKKAIADGDVRKKKEAHVRKTKKAITDLNMKSEKTTLGDLGVLGTLKEQMVEKEKKSSKKK
jgi:small subunit ribosomal protein S1